MRAAVIVLASVGIGYAPDALAEILDRPVAAVTDGSGRSQRPRLQLRPSFGKMPAIGVGKISDIFAGEGISESPTVSNCDGMEKIDRLWSKTKNGFVFANLVDFAMLSGYRRDVAGYAKALIEFDEWLGRFIDKVAPENLLIITADHGKDPAFRGTDQTREQVPLFVAHYHDTRDLGTRSTYANVAASLADFFRLPGRWPAGTSFLQSVSAQ